MPSLISSIVVHFSPKNRNLTPKAVLQHNLNSHQGDNLDAASFNYLDSLVIKNSSTNDFSIYFLWTWKISFRIIYRSFVISQKLDYLKWIVECIECLHITAIGSVFPLSLRVSDISKEILEIFTTSEPTKELTFGNIKLVWLKLFYWWF